MTTMGSKGRTRSLATSLSVSVVLTFLFVAPPSRLAGGDPDLTTGRWLLDFENDGSLQLTLKRGTTGHGHWSSSSDYQQTDFQGLRRPSGTSEAEAHFELVRDAGRIVFDGHLSEAGGSGRFSFSSSPEYLAELGMMGYRVPDSDTIFSLAIHDVSRAFMRDLESLGYKHVPLDDLLSMRIHRAGPEFIRELKSLGYDRLPADDLVSMRIHGATPEFIRGLKSLGYDRLSADDLVSMRIHGVTPDFIRELQELGYKDVTADDLVSMKIHGVSIDYVKKMKARFKNASVDDLVEMRIHGRN